MSDPDDTDIWRALCGVILVVVGIVIGLFIAAMFVGCCDPVGRITYDKNPDGRIAWSIQSPPDSELPATLDLSEDGVASAGPGRKKDLAIEQLGSLTWIGGLTMLVGGLSIIARLWFPIIPISASVVLIGLGAVICFIPKVVQEAWWVVLIAGIVAVGLYAWGLWDNRKLIRRGQASRDPQSQEEPQSA